MWVFLSTHYLAPEFACKHVCHW